MNGLRFDSLKYYERLKDGGLDENLARAQIDAWIDFANDLDEARSIFATKADLIPLATRADLASFPTRAEIQQALAPLATKAELEALATKIELEKAIARLATKDELEEAIAPLATKAELERFATKADLERFATKDDLYKMDIILLKWAATGIVIAFSALMTGLLGIAMIFLTK